ncbi:stage II sporulation protein D [Clostridium acetobutylicum]|uniref:SpoIID-like domain containing protein peptidoglycan-binding domain n=5 Tax=Clostridium acetobutylicum TaxID=1488 RepID=Q97G63_CLOAB|nr:MULTISPECIES: SpoIID/LytB domain-containing protein [Clostridium]AAK80460.1 SpoIID-like domain containing protein; peptidoglycan-binding domain [Clostridium acetobutylicum ATCC 824]ADZ21557.1 SpoIID-like domain protein containing protein [Clostridium acetobutylicum EA 2018]AEI32396.1 SpoIID-like domain-containing protein [Clostridium acetobutylicum DSM 1731]AWV79123.1 SpoIID/LytB domain-containing protein [Clostridium acetobutylicum]NOV88414.1 stage II sporulation protein D [Clostridium ace
MQRKSLKFVSMFTTAALTFSYCSFLGGINALAYKNPAYFNDLKVGLTTMANQTMSLKLNGDYTLNGTLVPSQTILNLTVSGSGISLNGTVYQSIMMTPTASPNLITISSGTQVYSYPGSFTFQVSGGKILPIDSTSMESYLKGVVGFEMSDYFPMEALKSQAVASRTYALNNLGAKSALGYDFDDTISYQTYKGYVPSDTHVMQAIDSTKGQVITYNDQLINAVFSASHGGYTEDVKNVWGFALPYLISKPDVYNGQTVDNASWSQGNKSFSNASIDTTLKSKGYLLSTDSFVSIDLNSITRYPSGRVSSVSIIYKDSTGTTKSKAITSDKCRTFLNLQSSMWYLSYDSVNGIYTFTGKGYGHGLGMSQIGAYQRANLGQNYTGILNFYYNNSIVDNVIKYAKLSSYTNDSTNNQIYLGQTVNYSALGQDGYGNYLFKFGVIKNGAVLSETDYNSNNTFSFTPTSSGDYQVYVKIKDKYSDKTFDDTLSSSLNVQAIPAVSIGSFTEDTTDSIVSQKSINFNASASGGTGLGYLYKYEISKDGVVVQTTNYSTSPTFTVNPNISGVYTSTLYVKDTLSNAAYDSKKSLNFNIYSTPSISALNLSKIELLQGQSTDFAPSITGGSGNYLYKYEIYRNGNLTATQDFSASSNFSYSPNTFGDYSVKLYVKDALSTSDYDAVTSANFKTYAAPALSSFLLDSPQMISGSSANFSAQISGGSGNPSYKFAVYNNGSLVTDTLYSLNSAFSFSPSTAGIYQVYVYGKDRLETDAYSVMGSTSLTVFNPVKISNVTASGYMYDGKPITLTSNTTDGSTSGFNYRYEVYKNGALVSSSDYSISPNYTFTPITYGTYTIKAFVKDNLSINNLDAEKDFSINVNKAPLSAALPLNYGMTSGDVTNLQNALIYLGYSISSATGYYGTQTKSVVSSIQSQNSLPVTGNVDTATLYVINSMLATKAGVKLLNFSTLPLVYGTTSSDTVNLQNTLIYLGYSISSATGYYGTQTKSVVSSIQSQNSLPVTGNVDAATLKVINNMLINKPETKNLIF